MRKGSFERTLKGIKAILEAKIPLRVGIIEMEQNKGQTQTTIEYFGGVNQTENV